MQQWDGDVLRWLSEPVVYVLKTRLNGIHP